MIQKRSVKIARHSTSVSLEKEFWAALQEIARRREQSLASLIAAADTKRAGNWPTWLLGLFSAWMMRSPQASPPTLAIAAVDGVLSPSSTFSVISSRHTTTRCAQEYTRRSDLVSRAGLEKERALDLLIEPASRAASTKSTFALR